MGHRFLLALLGWQDTHISSTEHNARVSTHTHIHIYLHTSYVHIGSTTSFPNVVTCAPPKLQCCSPAGSDMYTLLTPPIFMGLCEYLPRVLRGCRGDVLGMSWGCVVDVGMCRACFGDATKMLRGCIGDVQMSPVSLGMLRGCRGDVQWKCPLEKVRIASSFNISLRRCSRMCRPTNEPTSTSPAY